ncbi:MAG TPA: hypothetical protein VGR91_19775 [Stellaceae bacterium]|nr:hypothetical protein [Stellaceae bacterium]
MGRRRKPGERTPKGRLRSLALPPTPERLAHGIVEWPDRAIADEFGSPSRPCVAVDFIVLLERRGEITAAMRQAAGEFRAAFLRARFEKLKAGDPGRLRAPAAASEPDAARRRLWRALLAAGPLGSPESSCLWHVVGLDRGLADWALQYRIPTFLAGAVLVRALRALALHYRL